MSFRFVLKAARAVAVDTSLHAQMNGGPGFAVSHKSNAQNASLANLFLFQTRLFGSISRV
jgi:hypothetical protein